jgi:HlyD family secretion protein
MRANWSRLSLGLMTLGVILGAAWLVMRPSATMVDASRVESGPLSVTVESDGWTRVKDLYYVNAPVGVRLLRVLKKSGDAIKAGEVVASIEPSEPTFLTSRDVNQAKATVAVAEANRDQAKADLQRAKTETEYARYTYKRTKELNKSGYYSTEKLEEAELSLKTKIAAQESSEKTLAAKEMDLAKAKAEQQQPNSVTTYKPSAADCVNVTTPVDGRVLYVTQESETIMAPGATIMQVGDPTRMEIQLEMLTEDAVKVKPGAQARIEQWGGPMIKGKVRLVEPYAFTKTSALGIEEQRVNVIVDFDEPYENWRQMAHAFKVVTKIVWWESSDVLKVPMGAVFRQRNRWAVYVVEDGVARLRFLEIGHTTTLEAEVVTGLREGDIVIVHPGDRVRDGARVSPRRN